VSNDSAAGQPRGPLDPEGERLFDAMVRWRALATTSILLGFGAGFANLIVTSTNGTSPLSRGLAGVAVLLILAAVVATFVGWRARRRFLRWYAEHHAD